MSSTTSYETELRVCSRRRRQCGDRRRNILLVPALGLQQNANGEFFSRVQASDGPVLLLGCFKRFAYAFGVEATQAVEQAFLSELDARPGSRMPAALKQAC